MEPSLVEAIKTLVDKPAIDHDGSRLRTRRRSERLPATAADEPSRGTLTSRERQVLRQLADGKTNKEIGAQLSISARTVETHRARLMRKLNLHSISELVRYAIRQRIIKP
jgi:DNA-binding NarL/FixJ family response regulator